LQIAQKEFLNELVKRFPERPPVLCFSSCLRFESHISFLVPKNPGPKQVIPYIGSSYPSDIPGDSVKLSRGHSRDWSGCPRDVPGTEYGILDSKHRNES
jgi:hypothetical protein